MNQTITPRTRADRQPTVSQRILLALEKYHPLPLTMDDLVDEVEATRKTVQMGMTDLVRSNQVRRESVQMYRRGAHIPHFWLTEDPAVSHDLPPALDPACGTRMCWFDKEDPRVLFGDIREETVTVTDRTHREDGTRTLTVSPDVQLDFRNLPFADDSFRLVLFDPPHLLRAGEKSWMRAKYGVLHPDSWQADLAAGFRECFRVLKAGGTLIFKWSEVHIPLRDILALTPEKPLFGHRTRSAGSTYWVAFLKSEEA